MRADGPVAGVHVSLPELRRIGPDALRGAGLHLAQADEAALMVTWTEAAIGGALAEAGALRERPPSSPGRLAIRTADTGAVVVDAGGRGLLELGVRMADFACAEAAARPGTRVVVRGTSGARFVPYLVRRCGFLGYRAVGRYVPSATDADAPWAAAAWPREPARGRDRRLVVVRAPRAESARAHALAAIDDGLHDLLDGDVAGLVLCCDRPTAAGADRSAGGDDAATAASRVARVAARLAADPGADAESEARFVTALRDGIVVDAAHHAAFTALAAAIRVPTSERSRAQAG
jgi:hypothetical protein